MFVKFEHPFTLILSGPSSCGKTSFCIKLLENLKQLCSVDKFDRILWCYSERNSIPAQGKTRVTFHKGLPRLDEDKLSPRPSLIILDDLLDKAYSKEVSSLFTRGSHHRNVSIILITQNLFHQSAHSRDISLNAKYMVLFRNLRDKNQITHLARQVYPEDWRGFYNAYRDATKDPYSYLLVDFSQNINDLLRFRARIFPPGLTEVYTPVQHETDQIKLSYITRS